MKTPPRTRNATGFTLIEVMIAVLVLATGFLALTALQGALIQASADSKTRSQVASFAASEFDDLRLGGVDSLAIGSTTETASSAPAGDPLKLAAEAAGVSELTMTRTVEQYVADASGTFSVSAAAPGTNAYFKRVILNLGWTDASGQARSLAFTTDMSPLALNASKVMVDRVPPDDQGLRPVARRPSPVTEGMIPIATGGADDEATAATNPKPELVGGESGSYVSDTRFDVLTYSTDEFTPDGFVKFNKRIETAIVGCTCQNSTDGFSGGGADANYLGFVGSKAFRPAYWDGTSYAEPTIATAAVDSSPADVSQSALCDVCCRDHKDPDGVTGPKFSPWPGQDARHYRDNAGSLVIAGTGETYLETCRIIRVNGSFRVTSDPKIQDLTMVATREEPPTDTTGSSLNGVSNNSSATSAQLSAAGKAAYEDYVYDAVDDLFFSTSSVSATGNSADFSAIQASTSQSTTLNSPTYVPIKPASDTRWLHSRVFMTDYLEADSRNRLVVAANECETPTSAIVRAQCVLEFAPVATINTTEIADWSPRAKVAADTVPANLVALNSNYFNYARSSIRRHNSGLALFSAISPSDGSSPAADEQLFVQLSASAPGSAVWLDTPSPNPNTAHFFGDPTNPMRGYAQTGAPQAFQLSWSLAAASDRSKANDPSAEVTGGGVCTPNSANNSSNPYACSSPSTSAIELRLAGYNSKDTVRFSNPCGNGNVDRPRCLVYTFSGATVDNPSATILATSYTATNPGKLSESGVLTIPAINSGTSSRVTVSFLGPAITEATWTCPTGATEPVWDPLACD